MKRTRWAAVGLAAAVSMGVSVSAPVADATSGAKEFLPISQPTTDYTSATCAASITGDGGNVGSIGVCGNIVSFDRTNRLPVERQVPTDGWELWGTPPAVEDPTPGILVLDKYRRLRIDVRRPSKVSGVELEPKDDATATYTATFFSDEGCDDLIGKITRTVSGNGGAVLFAADTRPGVGCISVISRDEVAFAVAEIRVTPHLR